jgi:hypothetical protein
MRKGAKRPRPPKPPPITGSPLLLEQWFADQRRVDADVSQFAVGIALDHLGRAGITPHPELATADTWFEFSLDLWLSLFATLRGDGDKAWVRALFSELVEYSLLNPSGSPHNRLAELLEQFLGGADYQERLDFIELLPKKAGPALKLVEEREAEALRRLEEGSY